MNFTGNNAIRYLLTLLKPELDKKADKNQGTANAGKYWMVGSDGGLTFGTPATEGGSSGTQITDADVDEAWDAVFGGNDMEMNGTMSVPSSDYTFPSTLTATDICNDIVAGWNLGNTLESIGDIVKTSAINRTSTEAKDYETWWGNPSTTKEMIQAVKDKGFNAIRIPVTWNHHIRDNKNGEIVISEAWINRVKEVVDYAYIIGMYVIINAHHDDARYSAGKTKDEAGDTGLTWLDNMSCMYQLFHADDRELYNGASNAPLETNADICERITRLWTTIATVFRDYDNRLIFEGFNEMLGYMRYWSEPNTDSTSQYKRAQNVNKMNQAFVNAVRATGGNNYTRVLSVQTYGAGINTKSENNTANTYMSLFELPSDTVEDRIIVQGHYYSNRKYDDLGDDLSYFLSQDYPKMLGEVGSGVNTYVGSDESMGKVARSIGYYAKQANCPPFWWDDGNTTDNKSNVYGLLRRSDLSWQRGVAEEFIAGCNGDLGDDRKIVTLNTDQFEFGGIVYDSSSNAYGTINTAWSRGGLTTLQDVRCESDDMITISVSSSLPDIVPFIIAFFDIDGNCISTKVTSSTTHTAPYNSYAFRFTVASNNAVMTEEDLRNAIQNVQIKIPSTSGELIDRVSASKNTEKYTLPNGYTQLTYIKSTGEQYIDTGFKPNASSAYELKYTGLTDTDQVNDIATALGCTDGTNVYGFNLVKSSGKTRWAFRYGSSMTGVTIGNIGMVAQDKNVQFYNNSEVHRDSLGTWSIDKNMFIFARCNSDGTAGNYTKYKLRNLKIWDNGTLVRHFIPCKDSNGIVCLHDIVNNVTYQNTGTGNFESGEEVISDEA